MFLFANGHRYQGGEHAAASSGLFLLYRCYRHFAPGGSCQLNFPLTHFFWLMNVDEFDFMSRTRSDKATLGFEANQNVHMIWHGVDCDQCLLQASSGLKGRHKIAQGRLWRIFVRSFTVGRCDTIHSKSGETSCEEDVQGRVFGNV